MTPEQVNSPSLSYRRSLFLSLVAVLCLFATPALRAAGLRFDVFPGYDNLVPDEGWFPITCEIQNDGPGFTGIVEVSAQGLGRNQTRRLRVDLPTGTLKRVVIPDFTAASVWDVRLLDERTDKVRDEKPTLVASVTSHELPLVAGLSRTVTGLPSFPELTASRLNSSTYRAARLQAETFPDNPLAMESIDLLYLNSTKVLELKQPQVVALMAWMQNGGHLVIGVEQISDITGTPWLNNLMPCDLSNARNLADHPQFQQWLRSPWNETRFRPSNPNNYYPYNYGRRGVPPPPPGVPSPRAVGPRQFNAPNVLPNSSPIGTIPPDDAEFEAAPLPMLTGTMRDGTVLIGDAAAPLAITAERGRGKITVLTFSPEREPFVSWKNKGWFWAKLADIPLIRLQMPPNTQIVPRMSSDGIYGSMIDSKQVRKLPLPWLLTLLVAYLVVIGPLDQYWLKKINRQMLTWITFPLYVAGFSGLIYLIGFHLRAGELEWNELNVVDILPDLQAGVPSALLRGETYISIYSPVNARYEISSSQSYATLRGEYGGNYGGGAEASSANILQEGNYFDAEASVPVWTSQLYVSEWMQRAEPVPLAMTVSAQGGTWNVTIENKTDQPITRARLVLGERIFDVVALPPHQPKTFTFNNSEGLPLANFANQYGGQFVQAVNSRHASFGNNATAINDPIDASMAATFLSKMDQAEQGGYNGFQVFRSRDLGRFAGPDHAILLAWEPGRSESPALNRFKVNRLHRDTLLRLVVPVK